MPKAGSAMAALRVPAVTDHLVSRRRVDIDGRMATKAANSKTTPNVNAFTYAAHLPEHNSGALIK
jgi:hypothetical protein